MKDPWLASQEAAQSCCRACGGKLHRADDPRKAREVPHKLMEQWDRRYSFCCSTEGCRLRHTPVSVRFLGRKVYSEVFIVLISALMNGPSERRAGELHRELGLDVRTLKRWHQWWQKEFVSTQFWRLERTLLPNIAIFPRFYTAANIWMKAFKPGAITIDYQRLFLRGPLTGRLR